MARPPSIPYSIVGSSLFVGKGDTAQISLSDVPRATIEHLALMAIYGKVRHVWPKEGLDGAKRVFNSLAKNGRVTRKYVPRLDEETMLKACLVNYARQVSGANALGLAEAAKMYEEHYGESTERFAGTKAMGWARARVDEFLKAAR